MAKKTKKDSGKKDCDCGPDCDCEDKDKKGKKTREVLATNGKKRGCSCGVDETSEEEEEVIEEENNEFKDGMVLVDKDGNTIGAACDFDKLFDTGVMQESKPKYTKSRAQAYMNILKGAQQAIEGLGSCINDPKYLRAASLIRFGAEVAFEVNDDLVEVREYFRVTWNKMELEAFELILRNVGYVADKERNIPTGGIDIKEDHNGEPIVTAKNAITRAIEDLQKMV